MAAVSKILNDIENTRRRTSQTLNLLSDMVNRRFDVYKFIKENPIAVALVVFILGLFLAFFSRKIMIKLFMFGFGTLRATIFGYLSQKTIAMLLKKLK